MNEFASLSDIKVWIFDIVKFTISRRKQGSLPFSYHFGRTDSFH